MMNSIIQRVNKIKMRKRVQKGKVTEWNLLTQSDKSLLFIQDS